MIAFALSALLLSMPAQTTPAIVHVGDWLVGPFDAETCQMEAHFADHYLLNISENASGIGHLIFADDRWILKEGDTKPATYSWDGWKTQHKAVLTVVKASGGKSFLGMETDSGFTEEMTGSTGLWLRVPGVDFDDDFAIPNTKDLTRALVACNANH